jgi:hypothetical protein
MPEPQKQTLECSSILRSAGRTCRSKPIARSRVDTDSRIGEHPQGRKKARWNVLYRIASPGGGPKLTDGIESMKVLPESWNWGRMDGYRTVLAGAWGSEASRRWSKTICQTLLDGHDSRQILVFVALAKPFGDPLSAFAMCGTSSKTDVTLDMLCIAMYNARHGNRQSFRGASDEG